MREAHLMMAAGGLFVVVGMLYLAGESSEQFVVIGAVSLILGYVKKVKTGRDQ